MVVVAAAVAASCARTILFQEALPPRLRLAMGKEEGKFRKRREEKGRYPGTTPQAFLI